MTAAMVSSAMTAAVTAGLDFCFGSIGADKCIRFFTEIGLVSCNVGTWIHSVLELIVALGSKEYYHANNSAGKERNKYQYKALSGRFFLCHIEFIACVEEINVSNSIMFV